jgi:hypothetical protein
MPDFFPDTHLQSIIEATDGVLVEYRGQEAYFHCETPTTDPTFGFLPDIQGMARVLIGGTVFDNLEEETLITVDGDDYLVGPFQTPEDGGIVLIYLKRNTRP